MEGKIMTVIKEGLLEGGSTVADDLLDGEFLLALEMGDAKDDHDIEPVALSKPLDEGVTELIVPSLKE